MSDQGAIIITMDVPASTARGAFVSGAGTLSASLRAVGCLVEGTDASETKTAVQIGGTALGLFGATITAGAILQADVDGNLIAVVQTGDTDLECAIALEGGVDGELRRVKLL